MTTKKLRSVLTSLRAIPDGLPDHETLKRVECLQRPVVRLVAAVRPDLADPADDADTLPAWERMARRLEAICPELPRIDEVRDASGPVGDRELNLVTPGGMARWRDHAAAVVESLVELLESPPKIAPTATRKAKRCEVDAYHNGNLAFEKLPPKADIESAWKYIKANPGEFEGYRPGSLETFSKYYRAGRLAIEGPRRNKSLPGPGAANGHSVILASEA